MIGDIPFRRFENQIHDREMIRKVLDEVLVVHVGINDGEYPYVVPLNFGYEMTEERLLVYLHCAREGHKVDLWNADPKVSLTFSMFTNHPQDLYRGEMHDYRSVMANGEIRKVERHKSQGQHGRGMQAILRHNGRRPNQFSVRHYGFMDLYVVECDWKHVTAKSECPIERLEEVTFPTLKEIQESKEPRYDFSQFFNRKTDRAQVPAEPADPLPRLAAQFPEEGIRLSGKADEWQLTFFWETEDADSEPDCDVLALLLDDQEKVPRRYDLAFYNQKTDRNGAVLHLGDDLLRKRGQEGLVVYPSRIPEFCQKMVFWLSVHEADSRKQTLEMIREVQILSDDGLNRSHVRNYILPEKEWAGKQAAALVSLKKQTNGEWLLTASEERSLEDWRATSVFAEYGLVRWKE